MTEEDREHSQRFRNIILKHLIGLRGRKHCFVGAAVEPLSGIVHFFLVFQEKGKIFHRQRGAGAWQEIHDRTYYGWVKNLVECTLVNRRINSLRRNMAFVSAR